MYANVLTRVSKGTYYNSCVHVLIVHSILIFVKSNFMELCLIFGTYPRQQDGPGPDLVCQTKPLFHIRSILLSWMN